MTVGEHRAGRNALAEHTSLPIHHSNTKPAALQTHSPCALPTANCPAQPPTCDVICEDTSPGGRHAGHRLHGGGLGAGVVAQHARHPPRRHRVPQAVAGDDQAGAGGGQLDLRAGRAGPSRVGAGIDQLASQRDG